MKMVKSLLLVSAAGLVAVSGAQAADLPVKAKPVEYVKVCSLYGAGFYYIPGTDICLKIGAYFRAEYATATHGASLTNLDAIGADGQRTRITGPDYQQRARAFIFLDSRQQTAYGTLRAYMNIGHSKTSGQDSTASALRQPRVHPARWVHVGSATSYYDFYSSPATSYTVPWSSDTGDGGWKVAAYTAQLGNGLSASLSLEEPRRQVVANADRPRSAISGRPSSADARTSQVQWPDIVANLRVDQAWGTAQIMGALHDVGGGYYGPTSRRHLRAGRGAAGNICSGHPDDELGFASAPASRSTSR